LFDFVEKRTTNARYIEGEMHEKGEWDELGAIVCFQSKFNHWL